MPPSYNLGTDDILDQEDPLESVHVLLSLALASAGRNHSLTYIKAGMYVYATCMHVNVGM